MRRTAILLLFLNFGKKNLHFNFLSATFWLKRLFLVFFVTFSSQGKLFSQYLSKYCVLHFLAQFSCFNSSGFRLLNVQIPLMEFKISLFEGSSVRRLIRSPLDKPLQGARLWAAPTCKEQLIF